MNEDHREDFEDVGNENQPPTVKKTSLSEPLLALPLGPAQSGRASAESPGHKSILKHSTAHNLLEFTPQLKKAHQKVLHILHMRLMSPLNPGRHYELFSVHIF